MRSIVITCAITGAETTRQDHPELPISPQEIADAAFESYLAGASILHLHVRDSEGQPTQNLAVFKEAIAQIRAKCDIIIEVTTGGAVGMDLDERLQPLILEPEMASLDCGTCNFGDEYIINTLPMIKEAAIQMERYKIHPTLECFDLSHIDTAKILIKESYLKPPFHFGFVLNVPGGINYDAETLGIFERRIPENSYWTAIGIGKANLNAIYGAIAYGGFIRVGFEDNIYYTKGVLAKNNAQLVERAARIIAAAGCRVATVQDVRKMFQLNG